jgi:hypothetical protein
MTHRADRRPVLDATLRANPGYELVLYERLAPSDRQALEGLCSDPDFYGILRPAGGRGLAVQSVSCEAALLFSTLRESGPLPGFVARKLGAAAEPLVVRLVLDGVLEIAEGDRFVSGAVAHRRLCGAPDAALDQGRVARLSFEALRYAAQLQLSDPQALVGRLYHYNGIPSSPRLRRRFGDPETLWAHLCPAGSPAARLLADAWTPVTAAPDAARPDPWRHFVHRRPSLADPRPAGVVYKLYLSPTFEALPEALGTAVEVLTGLGVAQLKIGRGLEGVLRPDKLVAYFPTFEALAAAAERPRRALSAAGGGAGQGVPFSAAIDDGGLLSWGLDPPPRPEALAWGGRESWRLWVTRRLAAALVDAQRAPDGAIEPWRFAVERVRLEGFDTSTWTPSARIWRDAPRSVEQE